MQYQDILEELESLKNKKFADGMRRFGIRPKTELYGIPIPILRKIAKKIGKNHQLALQLWDSKIHEARILASFIDEPEKVTEKQFETWVFDFDSWGICDQVCGNLFDKTPFVHEKIFKYCNAKEEFVKRTAFTLIACLAVHDKKAKDKDFITFFDIMKKASDDPRNFVKKAVNWALRQIGKRNKALRKEAIMLAKEILNIGEKTNSKSAQWIAKDAIRELESKSTM